MWTGFHSHALIAMSRAACGAAATATPPPLLYSKQMSTQVLPWSARCVKLSSMRMQAVCSGVALRLRHRFCFTVRPTSDAPCASQSQTPARPTVSSMHSPKVK